MNRAIIEDDGRYVPYGIYRIGINIYTIYIQPIIIFSLILAWPALSIKDRFKAALISIPLQFAILLINIPFYVITLHEKNVNFVNYHPGFIRILWFQFLNMGGQQFMAILAFMVSIAPFYLIKPQTADSRAGRSDPCPCGSGKKYKDCCMK